MSTRQVNVADLHVHTTASDGAYSLPEVADMAAGTGLEIVAITDHDSVSSLDEAHRITAVEVVPGVELSSQFGPTREVHILGYFLDITSERLRATLADLQKNRRARLHAILEKLSEANIDLDPRDLLDMAEGTSVGRLHVAELLIEKGHVGSMYEAFRNFLGPEGTAFVPKTRLSVPDAIELVHSSGGAAVLAHPGSTFTADEIRSFAADGLDGIEAHYPRHTLAETENSIRLSAELNMIVTGGSDFHGRRASDIPLGAVRISRTDVDKLRDRSAAYGVRRPV